MSHAEDLVDAGYEYLRLGLRLIALTGKAPNGVIHPHGLKDAMYGTPDGAFASGEFEDAFYHPKTTGIGILTGPPYVVDIDGPEGAKAWLELVGEDEYIRDTWIAQTGRGLHLYMMSAEEFPTAKLAEKLDFKGAGGYVAAPPSLHPDGHTYKWLSEPGEPLLEIPDALYKVLSMRKWEAERRGVTSVQRRNMAPEGLTDGKWFPVATFDGIIAKVRDEPEGNRNGVLYWGARTMLEQGADEADLEELKTAAVDSGLTRRETHRTVRSAVEAGRG